MTATVEDVARRLGNEHLDRDAETQKVLWSPHESEVRLVETTTALCDDRDVLPFRFAPDPPEVPYPSVVVLLGVGDGKRIEAGEIPLPEGWAPLRPVCGRFAVRADSLVGRARCAWIVYVNAILDGWGSEAAMESLLDVRALYEQMTPDAKQAHLAFRATVAKAMLDRLYEFCDGSGGKVCCNPLVFSGDPSGPYPSLDINVEPRKP